MNGKSVYDEIVEAHQRGEEYDPEALPAEMLEGKTPREEKQGADAIAREAIEVCMLELLPAIVAETPALRAKVAACCFAHWRLGRE